MKVPDTKQERRRFIKEYLSQYQDKSFYCRALDCDVKVTDNPLKRRLFRHKIKIDNRLLRSISLSSVTDLVCKDNAFLFNLQFTIYN